MCFDYGPPKPPFKHQIDHDNFFVRLFRCDFLHAKEDPMYCQTTAKIWLNEQLVDHKPRSVMHGAFNHGPFESVYAKHGIDQLNKFVVATLNSIDKPTPEADRILWETPWIIASSKLLQRDKAKLEEKYGTALRFLPLENTNLIYLIPHRDDFGVLFTCFERGWGAMIWDRNIQALEVSSVV